GAATKLKSALRLCRVARNEAWPRRRVPSRRAPCRSRASTCWLAAALTKNREPRAQPVKGRAVSLQGEQQPASHAGRNVRYAKAGGAERDSKFVLTTIGAISTPGSMHKSLSNRKGARGP